MICSGVPTGSGASLPSRTPTTRGSPVLPTHTGWVQERAGRGSHCGVLQVPAGISSSGFVSRVRWNEGRCAEGNRAGSGTCRACAEVQQGETAYVVTEDMGCAGGETAYVVTERAAEGTRGASWGSGHWRSKAVRALRPEPPQHTGCGPQAPPTAMPSRCAPQRRPGLYVLRKHPVSCEFKF